MPEPRTLEIVTRDLENVRRQRNAIPYGAAGRTEERARLRDAENFLVGEYRLLSRQEERVVMPNETIADLYAGYLRARAHQEVLPYGSHERLAVREEANELLRRYNVLRVANQRAHEAQRAAAEEEDVVEVPRARTPAMYVNHPITGEAVRIPTGTTAESYLMELADRHRRHQEMVAEEQAARDERARRAAEAKELIEGAMPGNKRARLAGELLLGADPEFALLSNGVPTDISRMIPHAGPLGYDHSGWVAELRPKPTRTAWGLTRQLAGLMSGKIAQRLQDYRWRAGALCTGAPGRTALTLGGHIHFGHLKMMESPFLNAKTAVKTLAALTLALEAVDILPAKSCVTRREVSPYGRLEDVRGGDDNSNHWEYRAMPSWLYHPDTTFLCLTLGKLAVLHPKTIGQILADHKDNPSVAVKYCLERFKRDVDSRRALEVLPIGSPKKLVHDPEAEIREAWKDQLAEVKAKVEEDEAE